MFTVSLDHLHILVMLIVAFFSFRAYNSNTLAIEYEPQEEKVEQGNQSEENQNEPQVEKREDEGLEMSEERVENQVNDQIVPVENHDQVDSNNSIDVENVDSANVQSDLTLNQNKQNEVNTVQGSIDKIDDESVVIAQSQVLEKEDDQESTLLNRIENQISEEPCDEEEGNVECSSSSEDSSNSNSSGYPELSEQEKGVSRREKRKLIQKAKRVQKKLRREQQRVENQVELVEIQ